MDKITKTRLEAVSKIANFYKTAKQPNPIVTKLIEVSLYPKPLAGLNREARSVEATLRLQLCQGPNPEIYMDTMVAELLVVACGYCPDEIVHDWEPVRKIYAERLLEYHPKNIKDAMRAIKMFMETIQ